MPHQPTRRELRRQEQRKRRARFLIKAVPVIAAVTLAGLVVTDTLRIPGGQAPVLADSTSAEERARGREVDPTRPLTPTDPLRLWIAGDSLAGSLGPSLGAMTAETGVVQPVFDSRVSSGLQNSSFFDWPDHAIEELARLDPEAIAFVIGTNDAKLMPSGDTWQGDYAQKVEEMMELLVGNGRDVYWVAVPTMADGSHNSRAQKVNTVFQEVAEDFDEVTYVDAYTLFANDNGNYASSLRDSDGDIVTVRADDGVHLTGAGGDKMAEAVFYRLDDKWNISGQTVEGETKQVIRTSGSSQIEGTYRPTPTVSPQPTAAPTSTIATTTTTAVEEPPDTQPTTTTTVPDDTGEDGSGG